jgi:hypothetical protein
MRLRILFFAWLLFALSAVACAAEPVHQLRIYEIFDHNKQAFHDRFRDHAMRIMKSTTSTSSRCGKRRTAHAPSSSTCSNGRTRRR